MSENKYTIIWDENFPFETNDGFEVINLVDKENITVKKLVESIVKETGADKENKDYNADQISFLRLLASFFAQNKHLDKKDLVAHPLSEENPLNKFSTKQLEHIIQQAEKIKIR